MKDFDEILKIAGQGLIAFFLLTIMAVLFNSVNLGMDFNPFESLLTISVLAIFLIILALFVVFVIWIIKEFSDMFGGVRI